MFGDVVNSPMTFVGGCVVVISALSTVIGILWQHSKSQNSVILEKLEAMNHRIEEELTECKQDRKNIWQELREIQKGRDVI